MFRQRCLSWYLLWDETQSRAFVIYCIGDQIFKNLYFIISSFTELKQKYFTALVFRSYYITPLIDRGTMGVSYHEEHFVPPHRKDGFILESNKERDNLVLIFLGLSCYFSYINHRSHPHFTEKKKTV